MGFFEAISQVIRKIFVFKGRARRKEYWSWMLFGFLIGIATVVFMSSVPDMSKWLSRIVQLLGLSVAFRRLHDIGRSGWWYGGYLLVAGFFEGILSVDSIVISVNVIYAYGLAALVYSIVLLVWFFTEGTHGPNKYGDDPKRESIEVQNNL